MDAPTSDFDRLAKPPSVEELSNCLRAAWEIVRSEHPPLFPYGDDLPSVRFERALCFRFGLALESILAGARRGWLAGWSNVVVDAELARAGQHVKLAPNESPDLVIHVRGTDDWNLVAIEAKHRRNPLHNEADRRKLKELLSRRNYRYAFAVRLDDEPLAIYPVEDLNESH